MVKMTLDTPKLAWHFLPLDEHAHHGLHIKVEKGQTLRYTHGVTLFYYGLHYSTRVFDDLKHYAPSFIIERVLVSGQIHEEEGRGVASERTCVWKFNARNVIFECACKIAERALDDLHLLQVAYDIVKALRVVRAFIAGAATAEDIQLARDAARRSADAAPASVFAAYSSVYLLARAAALAIHADEPSNGGWMTYAAAAVAESITYAAYSLSIYGPNVPATIEELNTMLETALITEMQAERQNGNS